MFSRPFFLRYVFLPLFFSLLISPVVYSADESFYFQKSESSTVVGPDVEIEEFSEEFETPEEEVVVAPSRFERQVSPTAARKKTTGYAPTKVTGPAFPSSTGPGAKKDDGLLPGGRIKMSGKYRLALGVSDEHQFFVNDANADLQERNFRYLFGERLNNTYDPAVYSQYLLNVDFSPKDKFDFYVQLVADPWSYVGTTGDQEVQCDICTDHAVVRYNLKYFGAFNSTINEIYRTHYTDSIAFPIIKVHDGQLTAGTTVHGFFDYNPATGGLPFTIPEHKIDYEFRPVRKLWMDYTEDEWHARVFAFADQSQALFTDDPLELSNHKDYWQQSPWLYQYEPIQFYTDRSFARGYYSDTLSFLARDSAGNRLVLLRGASFEADYGKTYIAATVASPYTPWEEDIYTSVVSDNVPGAVRIKHQVTDKWMMGGVYTFRTGLIDDSVADINQVVGVDTKYDINKYWSIKGEVAGSHNERDLLTDERYRDNHDGYAVKAILQGDYDHQQILPGHTNLDFRFTLMDKRFNPNLSRYTNTRDDHFWGNHITFMEYSPDIEHFRIGDGVDINRYVFHIRWKEQLFKERFFNLFDVRNVHRSSDNSYIETVLRDEVTIKVNPKLTFKGLFRWHGLPKSKEDIEPFIANFYFVNFSDPSSIVLKNFDVPPDADPSRFTYAGAVQYILNKEWTFEGFIERTNDVPDFPRGLLNNTFRDAPDRLDGLLIDHLQTFLYRQGHLGGIPPYEYFTITRQRVIYKPIDRLTYIFHAAQNGYKYAGGIDDNISHQGLSVNLAVTKKLNLFMDYTHSLVIDVPKLISTDFIEHDFRGHHNFYASMDYKIHPTQLLRVEYGVFGLGTDTPLVSPYSTTTFSLPTLDTEHLLRVSLTGDF